MAVDLRPVVDEWIHKAVKRVEASLQRPPIERRETNVPLSRHVRPIPGRLQLLGECHFGERYFDSAGRGRDRVVVPGAHTGRVSPGQQRRAGWRACEVSEVKRQIDTGLRKAVYVRRCAAHIRRPKAHVIPAPVVYQIEDNIRRVFGEVFLSHF